MRIRKVYSLMIHKYFMLFVSVRDNENVNAKSLIIAATCNKRFFTGKFLNSDFINSSITTPLFFNF